MAVFVLVSNIANGAGLQKDTEILRGLLESYGHVVHAEMFNARAPSFRHVDVVIFLEVVDARWIRYGRRRWVVPNCEWWYGIWDRLVPSMDRVLCKTKDCYDRWSRKVGSGRCVYVGFESIDYYREDIEREPRFLHLAGKSLAKNTSAVVSAWKQYQIQHPLIISTANPEFVRLAAGVSNVTVVERFSDVTRIMNKCRYHVMPSQNEGFGHALHEALACKGVVITTDAPPMNEFSGIPKSLLVPVCRRMPRMMTEMFEVEPVRVAEAVDKAVQLEDVQLDAMAESARAGFLGDREYFRATFAAFVRAHV